MTEHTPESQEPFRSLSYQAMQTLWRAFPVLLRLAVLPFALSVGAVILARLVGPPARYGFDILHGLFLLSYITSVSRVSESQASGQLVTGPNLWGWAVPRPIWPGVRPLLGLLGEALLLIIPGIVLLFIATMVVSAALSSIDSLVLEVVGILLPEFILNTLLGLVLGAGVAKIIAERNAT